MEDVVKKVVKCCEVKGLVCSKCGSNESWVYRTRKVVGGKIRYLKCAECGRNLRSKEELL